MHAFALVPPETYIDAPLQKTGETNNYGKVLQIKKPDETGPKSATGAEAEDDVRNPSASTKEIENMTPVRNVRGVGPALAGKLAEAKLTTAEELATAGPETLAAINGIGSKRAVGLQAAARNAIGAEPAAVSVEVAAPTKGKKPKPLKSKTPSTKKAKEKADAKKKKKSKDKKKAASKKAAQKAKAKKPTKKKSGKGKKK